MSGDFERNEYGRTYEQEIRYSKAEKNKVYFANLIKKFNLEDVIEIKSNLYSFKLNNKKYFFGIVSKKIRIEGNNKWSGKIMTILNKNKK